jgi:flavin-dependent dehydrogenase
LTGGGIYYAYLSGKMAADFISLNLESGHNLSYFEKEWEKTHGRSISLQWKLNVMFRMMWTDKGWDESLKKISENYVFSKNLAESWATYKFENKSIWARMFLTIFYNLLKNKII